jgi:hypothetical protein
MSLTAEGVEGVADPFDDGGVLGDLLLGFEVAVEVW